MTKNQEVIKDIMRQEERNMAILGHIIEYSPAYILAFGLLFVLWALS